VHNSESGDFGSGERSRFITQLLREWRELNPKVEIAEKVAAVHPPVGRLDESIEIAKSPEIMEKLKARAEKGFSPSSLNVYRNCPLQFYFQYIAGLSELDEVEETIAAQTFGTALHGVLEELYKEFIGKSLKAKDLKNLKSSIEPLSRQFFMQAYKSGQLEFGKNLLSLKVAIRYLQRFLDEEIRLLEKEGCQVEILDLEKAMETALAIKTNGEVLAVKLYGKADRIDRTNGLLRIIDYKTGRAEDRELNIREWDDFAFDYRLNKAFQLLMYAYLFSRSGHSSPELQSGILSFRELNSVLKPVKVPIGDKSKDRLDFQDLKRFEKELQLLLQEIFNPKIGFSQTDDFQICGYCAFREICNR